MEVDDDDLYCWTPEAKCPRKCPKSLRRKMMRVFFTGKWAEIENFHRKKRMAPPSIPFKLIEFSGSSWFLLVYFK